jgi:S13-like H2TH domain
MTLPAPDPAVGSAAAKKANDDRAAVTVQLREGTMTLAELFETVEAEESDHYIVGHMHLRHALLALPHIGETRADEIIADLGLEGDRHLAAVGVQQQAALIQAVIDHGGMG